MSLPTQLLFTVGLPAAFAGLAYHSPPTAALVPLLLSPTILAIRQYRHLPKEKAGHFEVAVWTYFGSSIFGPLVAAPLQLGLCSLMFKAFFGAQASRYMQELQRVTLENVPTEVIDERKLMSWTSRYFLSLAIFSYVGAALVEEAIKYLALRLAVHRAQPKHENEYLIYAAVAGLGYGTIENILVTYASVKKEETGGMIALNLFERIIFASMGHTIMALLTGLQSIRRDARGEKLSLWQVLARAVAYHGTWDFILFSVSAWNGNVGWIHPTDVGSIVFALSSVIALQVRAACDASEQLKELQLSDCK
jgi:RsiW-degrading membrane proteinase PrsW (M82 family)